MSKLFPLWKLSVRSNGSEMSSALRLLLHEPAAAAELSERGLAAIHARHSCAHRADELLAILQRLDARGGDTFSVRPTGIGVMRVCFFGSSLVSCYWNGAATYYRGLLRALAARGHVVTFYEPDALDRQRHRDIPDPGWAEVVVYPATPDGWMPALEQAAQRADLLVKASGIGIFDDELEAAVPDAARPGTIVAYWDVDAPATLDGMSSNPVHPLRRAVLRYDVVFTYGGGQPVINAYQSFGARRCVPIYNGLDPDTHYSVPAQQRHRCDLSLLANRLPDREARIRNSFSRRRHCGPTSLSCLAGPGGKPVRCPRTSASWDMSAPPITIRCFPPPSRP